MKDGRRHGGHIENVCATSLPKRFYTVRGRKYLIDTSYDISICSCSVLPIKIYDLFSFCINAFILTFII